MALMTWTCARYIAMRREQVASETERGRAAATVVTHGLSTAAVLSAMAVLITLLFAKNAYAASFSSFYTFYLIEKFGVSVQTAQVLLFVYLVVGAIGVVVGGMIGDRIGRKRIIWLSMLGALPFALLLPHANLTGTVLLGMAASFIMASAFSQILIFAIDLVPHRVGLVGGLFYGLAFGLGGIAAAGLGVLADQVGIVQVFTWCAWLPAIGVLTWLLPRIER
jgi:FSR family fosmidomycin resistance protein-like MFS transporter